MSMHTRQGFAAAKTYQDAVGQRVARFIPMVRKMAWHLSGSTGATLDVEDLMQAGLVALTECAQKHEGPGEDGFAAYAKLRVRGAMVDQLRSAAAEARGARQRRRQWEQAEQTLRNELRRDPTQAEIVARLGIGLHDAERWRADTVPVNLRSLDECYSDSDIAFASEFPDAETMMLEAEDRELLVEAITDLPERLQLVIQLYYVEELNLTEIAQVIDVSVPRVHQLKAAALQKLAAILKQD